MIPISLPYIYNLSTAVHPLADLEEGKPITDYLYILLTAETQLNGFLTKSIYSAALKASMAPGMALLGQISTLAQEEDKNRILNWFDFFHLKQALREFEAVLTAEMNVGSAFWVSKKRGYDTSDLLNTAENLFPPELVRKVPEAISDVRDAGRCLAFELGTAAGFHIVRATELVLRRYYDVVTAGAPRPATTNMGDFLRELDNRAAGKAKTRITLREFKDFHRNELIHPEIRLSLDQGIGILNIAQSAIVAMLDEIPEPPILLEDQPALEPLVAEMLLPGGDIESQN